MIDHLVYATPDLAGTERELRERGVELSQGGPHVGLGTRNCLADLGDGRYLEVVGPDLGQPGFDGVRMFGIDDLAAPRLVTWAAGVRDLDAVAAGHDYAEPFGMSRRRPDGVLLAWRLAWPVDDQGGVVPFLIDWADSAHPAETAAKGAHLLELRLAHPDPAAISAILRTLGVDLEVTDAARPSLTATLATRTGELVLS
ncbi:VOC family protein [Amycolatopsis nigrescens]|uniref:VOC family protein n=1 Tax=Amycolatopsis nigrescens TaxID=381445 RepID=UPI000369820C|nr:VOC family protein [Amycolatopsis nigrescens]